MRTGQKAPTEYADLIRLMATDTGSEAVEAWETFAFQKLEHAPPESALEELSAAILAAGRRAEAIQLRLDRAWCYLASGLTNQRAVKDISDVCTRGSAEERFFGWLTMAWWARSVGDKHSWKNAVMKAHAEASALLGRPAPQEALVADELLDLSRIGVRQSSEMSEAKPGNRFPHAPAGGVEELTPDAIAEALDRADSHAREQVLRALRLETFVDMQSAFEEAARRSFRDRVFGNSRVTLSRFNKWLSGQLGNDGSEEEKRFLANAVQHFLRTHGWVLVTQDGVGGQLVECTLATGEYKAGRRYLVRKSGGDRDYLTTSAKFPNIQARPG